jgi:DNA processing protein
MRQTSGQLALDAEDFVTRAISPLTELGAYEALWDEASATFKTIADLFRKKPGAVPSDFVSNGKAKKYSEKAIGYFSRAGIKSFGVRVHGAGEYPNQLRDAKHPIELLYYRGWWELVETPCVSIVGTRNPTEEGKARARKLVKYFVGRKFTIVSGLARGIDTEVHKTALEEKGNTIAVIGTPLSEAYPKENADLQERIAREQLLTSQVPVCRYNEQGPTVNRTFFPERNITMSALTKATIIVEAGETSGTLTQARAALHQGRKLFILDSCFKDERLTWPRKYEERGAVRVRDYDDIERHLGA